MSNIPILTSDRLILRGWRGSDREAFVRMNADPRVMEFFAGLRSRQESDARVDRIEAHFREHGFGLWAAELRRGDAFIGFIGLDTPSFEAAFTPCVELGWRLAAEYWGRGLATEGAQAVVQHAFQTLALDELVSTTVPANTRSRRVMEKLGMRHNPADDFDHPLLPDGHPLKPHVLYRLRRREWVRSVTNRNRIATMDNTIDNLQDRLGRDRQIKLSVFGRRSGKTITNPVWFVSEGEKLYLLPVHGSDTQWYQNVLKNPQIRIHARGAEAELKAKPITNSDTVNSVLEKFREKYGAADVKKYYSKFDVAVVAALPR